jgi:ABC-type glycerol-3-phosphate transport system permease component
VAAAFHKATGATLKYDYNITSTAAVVASVPIVVVYLILQRYLVSGLSAGALK